MISVYMIVPMKPNYNLLTKLVNNCKKQLDKFPHEIYLKLHFAFYTDAPLTELSTENISSVSTRSHGPTNPHNDTKDSLLKLFHLRDVYNTNESLSII